MSVLVLPDSLSMSPLFCRFCSRWNSGWWSRLRHRTAQAETCIRHLQAIRVLRDPYAPYAQDQGGLGPPPEGAERRQDNHGGRAGSGGAGWAGGGPGVSAGLCEVLRDWGQAQEGPKPGKETFSQTEIPPRENCQQTLFRGRRGHGDKGRRRAAWSGGRDAEWEKHRPLRLCKSQKQGRLAPCSCQNTQRLSAKITTMTVILQETKMNHG